MAVRISKPSLPQAVGLIGDRESRSLPFAQTFQKAGVPLAEGFAYLTALSLSPELLDDQTISGCTPANATKITAALTARGKIIVLGS
jgi:hypothetical protein